MPNIEIRDTRRKQMFQVDDEYLNGYARLCGGNATLVYLSLCRHANRDQQAWPSIELIQAELAIGSHNTVRLAIRKLEDWGIIQVVRSKNKETKRQNVNQYILLDKSQWKAKPMSPSDTRPDVNSDPNPMSITAQKPMSPSDTEGNTYKKETHIRRIATPDGVTEPNQVNVILEKFQMVLNPTINYGNQTQRKAVQELLDLMGEEKLLRTIDYAGSIKSEQFAPVITTPYQLKEKLAQLISFRERQQSKKRTVTFIS